MHDRDDFLDERFTSPTPETAAVKFMRAEVHNINRWALSHIIFPFLNDSVLLGMMQHEGKVLLILTTSSKEESLRLDYLIIVDTSLADSVCDQRARYAGMLPTA